ncbi:MAG TPA: carboxypeptidase regulatory-like domain-containing protein [Gemmatimonadaceae bacterium]
MAGQVFSTVTDSLGRYQLTDVPSGPYLAGFFHPLLDSLGLSGAQMAVQIHQRDQVVHFATPSPQTFAREICPPGTVADSLAMLLGFVRDTRTGLPLPRATVVAAWNETLIGRRGIRSRSPQVPAPTDGNGWFGICGLPADVQMMVRAVVRQPGAVHGPAVATDTTRPDSALVARAVVTADTTSQPPVSAVDSSLAISDSSGYVEVTLRPGAIHILSFLVGGGHDVTVTAADTVVGRNPTAADTGLILARRGTARLEATVLDARGQIVRDARAQVWGTARHALSNSRGTFTLDSLPGGTHLLEVRAIGFAPVKEIVHLRPEETAKVTVVFAERAVAMPTITVRGQLVYSRKLAGFEERRRRAMFGYFLGPEDLENRPFTRVSDLLTQIAGVRSDSRQGGGIQFRGTKSIFDPNALLPEGDGVSWKQNACQPVFFVDGRRSFLDINEINMQYPATEIAAVEVYTRASQVPSEYQIALPECGVVALWTRPPPMRIKK